MNRLSAFILSLALIPLLGCTEQSNLPEIINDSFSNQTSFDYPDANKESPNDTIKKELTVSNLSTEEIQLLVDANNQFSFEYYDNVKESDGNIFFSPYSISTALAMTYEGARGKTADQMQSVLHVPKEGELRRKASAQVYNEINKDDKNYSLSTANALWVKKEYEFNSDYFGIVEDYYGGKVTNIDFRNSKSSSSLINTWIENQTNGKITDLISPEIITPNTRLILTNAIYFKGKWINQFNKNKTKEEDFRVTTGKTVTVHLMQSVNSQTQFNYLEMDTFQILELPYSGEELSMLIFLPKEDNLKKFEKKFTFDKLQKWKQNMEKEQVDVFIPRFKFEAKYSLTSILSEMGMPLAFSDSADFTGMENNPEENLKIDEVIHQAFVEVNEEGTEAVAATAVGMGGITSVGQEPIIPTFRADHTFIFIIQDKRNGNILFMGRVIDPTAKS